MGEQILVDNVQAPLNSDHGKKTDFLAGLISSDSLLEADLFPPSVKSLNDL